MMTFLTVSPVRLSEVFIKFFADGMAKAGMNLSKWVSNRPHLLSNLAPDPPPSTVVKALGIGRDTSTDELIIPSPSLLALPDAVKSKRGFLVAVASAYDPMGFTTPVSITGRLLLQSLWSADLSWDQSVTPELTQKLSTWIDYMNQIGGHRLSRCLNAGGVPPIHTSLHIFADASPKAYGALATLIFPSNVTTTNRPWCLSSWSFCCLLAT